MFTTLSNEDKKLVKSIVKKKKQRGMMPIRNVYYNRKNKDGKTAYCKGYFYSEKTNERMTFRSSYELRHFINLEGDSSVLAFHSEIMEVPYTDSLGKKRIYIPDLVVIKSDGSVEVHEIKPKVMVTEENVSRKAQACRTFATKTFGQKVKYLFITEEDLFKTPKEYTDFVNKVAKKWKG